MLDPWLKPNPAELPSSIPDPLGNGPVPIVLNPFGSGESGGVLVAGSRRADFPTEVDRLLLGVGANQAALSQVQKAVDSGQPVPIDVTNGNDSHQMVVIASNGGELEIYNPWGYSMWVTNQQFVSNQLGALTNSQPPGMPTAFGIELPSS